MCLKWLEVIIGCQTETHAHSDSGTLKKLKSKAYFICKCDIIIAVLALYSQNESKALFKHRKFRVYTCIFKLIIFLLGNLYVFLILLLPLT